MRAPNNKKLFTTIAVRTAAHERLKQLVGMIAAKGWKVIGAKRTTSPTIADVVDEALKRLAKKG